jgi:plastocyanin
MTNIQATSTASLSASSAATGTNATHASTSMQGGKAVFENDNYRITAGDDNNVNITNKKTGENYNIWGDPHVDIDGKHAFDFWGTTTFKLEDGTKVTIETTPWNANNGATLASKVAITSGDYGVEISGVDTNKVGDLKIDEAKGWGSTLDWTHDDGNVLQENPAGKGFLGIDAQGNIKAVDQNFINGTDLTKNPPAQATQQKAGDFLQHLFSAFSGLLSASFSGAFLSALQGDSGEGRKQPEPATRDSHRFSLTFVRLEF